MPGGEVKVVDPVKDSRWDRFVMSHPHSTIYHHSIWSELIRQTYGYTPYFLAVEDGGEDISGILPLFRVKSWLTGDRLISLSFAHACGPLARRGSDISRLLDHALSFAQNENCDYLEIRIQGNAPKISNPEFVKHNYFSSFVLEINSDPGESWRNFGKKSIQYSIKKAQKSDLLVTCAESAQDVEAFYQLNLRTRKKHGMPPQPFSFFDNLWRLLKPRGMVRILMAEHDHKVVAGIMLFVFKETIIYAYNVSEEEYLSFCPNHLLLWEAIQWACKSGYRHFDFGRTSPDNQGLWDFKRRWGTIEIPITHYYWPRLAGPASIEENSIKYQILTSFWRRLPTFLTQILAPHLYKHLG